MNRALITQMLEAVKAGRHGHCDHVWADAVIKEANEYLAAPEQSEPVAWCELSIGGKSIAYFDGKPIIMTGKVGNDCHTTPLYTHPAPKAEPVLQDIEQYRMQMAAICTAALGYWKEGDSIHPDYDTPALRDVAKLYAKYGELYKAKQPVNQQLLEALKLAEAALSDIGDADREPGDDVAWCEARAAKAIPAARAAIAAAEQAQGAKK